MEQLQIAKLDEDATSKVRSLEQELDAHVMAFERGQQLADLDDSQLSKVKQIEDELGVTLLVYKG